MTDQDINDLLRVFDNPCHCYPLNVVEAIRLLVKQRDEARREVCLAYGLRAEALAAATRRGWNCFDAKEGER